MAYFVLFEKVVLPWPALLVQLLSKYGYEFIQPLFIKMLQARVLPSRLPNAVVEE